MQFSPQEKLFYRLGILRAGSWGAGGALELDSEPGLGSSVRTPASLCCPPPEVSGGGSWPACPALGVHWA